MTSTKKISKKEQDAIDSAKAALNAKSFTDETQAISLYQHGQVLQLNIDQVDTYDKNPRIHENAEYDAIYASIKTNGLDGTLNVTQRPGDDPLNFFLMSGGNTRLGILKKLYKETGLSLYYNISAKYIQWQSESTAVIGHLIENDVRGEYLFIDRALGIRQAKIELEAEMGRVLKNQQLIKILTDAGYNKVNKITIIRMNYAVDVLYPVCPTLLARGIGPRHIDAIRKLFTKVEPLFIKLKNGSTPEQWHDLVAACLVKQEEATIEDADYAYSYQQLHDDVIASIANDNDKAEINHLEIYIDQVLNSTRDNPIDIDVLLSQNSENESSENKPHTEDLSESTVKTHSQKPPVVKTKVTASDPLTQHQQAGNDNKQHGVNSTNNEGFIEPIGSETSTTTTDATTFINNPVTDNEIVTEAAIPPNQPTHQDRVQEIVNGQTNYDSGLIAAKGSFDAEGLKLHNSSAHQVGHQWSDFEMDYEASVFTDLPISCSDVREYAPLPNDVAELRQIMFDKAFYFQAYVRADMDIKPLETGAGFTITGMPVPVKKRSYGILQTRDPNPRTQQQHKSFIAWWLLLGFTDMVQLNHLRKFDLIKKYQPEGELKKYLLCELEDYSAIGVLGFEGAPHQNLVDLIPLFIADAEPRELSLLMELMMVANKLHHAADHDIWATTGRGVKK